MKITLIKLVTLIGLFILGTINVQAEAPSEQEAEKAGQNEGNVRHGAHRAEMKAKMKMRHKKGMEERLTHLDTNDDGKIELSEYLSNAEERFNNMDINGDKFVTQEEAREAHKQMREKQRMERQKNHKGMRNKNLEDDAESSE